MERKQSAIVRRLYYSTGNARLGGKNNSYTYVEYRPPTEEYALDSFKNQQRGLQPANAYHIYMSKLIYMFLNIHVLFHAEVRNKALSNCTREDAN